VGTFDDGETPASAADQPKRLPCALGAGAEQLAGTAAYDVTHLLIEHPGHWGRKALEESLFPEHVRATVAARAADHGIRVSLIRRHGRTPTGSGFHVFGAHTTPGSAWLGITRMADPDELLGLDLGAWAEGRMAGLDRVAHPLLLVCTNGRRDACCAEFGRPIARALSQAHPEVTWEVTHLGGHRFAGAMLTLPSGLSYGRLDPSSAREVARRTLAGELDAAYLRGRVAYPQPVQAAEIHLLEKQGLREVDALTVAEVVESDSGVTVTFTGAAGPATVRVARTEGPAVRASCGDEEPKRTTYWRVLD